jgi:RNA polymerase sigma factor (sigma-70 family)
MVRRDPLDDPGPLIKRVYSYVAYRLGEGPDAEDVTSETFERAMRYRETYDPTRGNPSSWLIGIARRQIAMRHSAETAGGLPEELPSSENLEDDSVRRVVVAAAVARLGDRDRELIALRYGADLTAREIGELLETQTNAIEVALHRALARLRVVLEEQPEAEIPQAGSGL